MAPLGMDKALFEPCGTCRQDMSKSCTCIPWSQQEPSASNLKNKRRKIKREVKKKHCFPRIGNTNHIGVPCVSEITTLG